MKTGNPVKRSLSWLYKWLRPVFDPIYMANGLRSYRWFWRDWRSYGRLPQAEPLRAAEAYPQLHDKTAVSTIDPHYFYVNAWAMRRVTADKPPYHVDVASQVIFANLLAAVLPVLFVDYRPLHVSLSGLASLGGSILALPFANNSVASLSCLHVAEHIGLGRYGDPLDPLGSQKAARELARVLAPGGNLYFALPVGQPRLQFNAHRIHDPQTICAYFADLKLVEFCGVDDDGRFAEKIEPARLAQSAYACGLFWFKKPSQPIHQQEQ